MLDIVQRLLVIKTDTKKTKRQVNSKRPKQRWRELRRDVVCWMRSMLLLTTRGRECVLVVMIVSITMRELRDVKV